MTEKTYDYEFDAFFLLQEISISFKYSIILHYFTKLDSIGTTINFRLFTEYGKIFISQVHVYANINIAIGC